MNYYERALQLKEETVAHRRWFHTNAEVGLNMPRDRPMFWPSWKSWVSKPSPVAMVSPPLWVSPASAFCCVQIWTPCP